jgi:transcriptional regulator with GAF, ATPase, and Fis domain
MLRRITQQMAGVREPEDLTAVLQAIVHGLVEHAGLAAVQIWLFIPDRACPTCGAPGGPGADSDERVLHACAVAGEVHREHMRTHHRLPLGWNLPGVVAETGQAMLVNDAQEVVRQYLEDPASLPIAALGKSWDADVEWIGEGGFQAGAAYPLFVKDRELVGAFSVVAHRPIGEEEFAHLGVFAHQAAVSIRSAQMFQEINQLKNRLVDENAYLQEALQAEAGFEGIVGESQVLRVTQRSIERVAPTDSTVLLRGETGTGKELIARAIHALSPRRQRPLIKVNCGAISPSLVESELFGHERGAFTGASQRRIGRFELADRGTLFLDEVGELPLELQVKLLRVLQEQEFERVGGDRTIRVDVRLIVATHRDLEADVKAGRFRADLFYRLNVFPVRVPPLRERLDDLSPLVGHFVQLYAKKLAKPLRGISERSLARLQAYSWPGNIRELQNVVERACVLAGGPVVEVTDAFDAGTATGGSSSAASLPTLEEMEREHIRTALERTGGRIAGPAGAAALLAIHPNTLRSRMERLGLRR